MYKVEEQYQPVVQYCEITSNTPVGDSRWKLISECDCGAFSWSTKMTQWIVKSISSKSSGSW